MINLTVINIKLLQGTTKRLEKEKIIKEAWLSGDINLFRAVKLCYDPFITFGVADKMVPTHKRLSDPSEWYFNFEYFVALATDLSKRKITGGDARESILGFTDGVTEEEWTLLYRPVLLKDLRIGCSETTFNKVLEKLAKEGHSTAKDYIVQIFEVQLAKDGAEIMDKMEVEDFSTIILQNKLDGVRIITVCDIENNKITHYTRNGKENSNFPHITEEFWSIMPTLTQSMVFDGEVIGTNFQSLMTQVNRKTQVSSENTSLALFDCLPLVEFKTGISKEMQIQRIEKLDTFSSFFDNTNVFILPYLILDPDLGRDKKTFIEFNKKAIEDGYEGIMIKDATAPYECKRTKAWLKVKPFIEESLEVIRVEEGTGKNVGRLGNLICTGTIEDGRKIEVSCGGGFSDEQRIDYWNRKEELIGLIAEIRADCFSKSRDLDDVWSMRFPRFKGFRGSTPGEKI